MEYRISIAGQLSSLLKSLRKKSGLTQQELGLRLGVSQRRVAAIEAHPERARSRLRHCDYCDGCGNSRSGISIAMKFTDSMNYGIPDVVICSGWYGGRPVYIYA